MESRGGQEGLVSVPQVDTLSSETQSCGLLAHPYHPVKTALHFLLSAPSFSPCWVASQSQPGSILGTPWAACPCPMALPRGLGDALSLVAVRPPTAWLEHLSFFSLREDVMGVPTTRLRQRQ